MLETMGVASLSALLTNSLPGMTEDYVDLMK